MIYHWLGKVLLNLFRQPGGAIFLSMHCLCLVPGSSLWCNFGEIGFCVWCKLWIPIFYFRQCLGNPGFPCFGPSWILLRYFFLLDFSRKSHCKEDLNVQITMVLTTMVLTCCHLDQNIILPHEKVVTPMRGSHFQRKKKGARPKSAGGLFGDLFETFGDFLETFLKLFWEHWKMAPGRLFGDFLANIPQSECPL